MLYPPPIPERWSYPTDDGSLVVPGIICHVCGETWGMPNGEVVRGELKSPALVERLRDPQPLPLPEQQALVRAVTAELAASLGLTPCLAVGTRIGPLRVALSGLRVPDFSTSLFTPVVRDRVISLLRESGATGFEAHAVEITRVRREPKKRPYDLPRLFEMDVRGRVALAPEAKAFYDQPRPCPGCERKGNLRLPKGMLVDETTWDGSDLFKIEGEPWVLMAPRIATLLIETKLTGFRLMPAREFVNT